MPLLVIACGIVNAPLIPVCVPVECWNLPVGEGAHLTITDAPCSGLPLSSSTTPLRGIVRAVSGSCSLSCGAGGRKSFLPSASTPARMKNMTIKMAQSRVIGAICFGLNFNRVVVNLHSGFSHHPYVFPAIFSTVSCCQRERQSFHFRVTGLQTFSTILNWRILPC